MSNANRKTPAGLRFSLAGLMFAMTVCCGWFFGYRVGLDQGAEQKSAPAASAPAQTGSILVSYPVADLVVLPSADGSGENYA